MTTPRLALAALAAGAALVVVAVGASPVGADDKHTLDRLPQFKLPELFTESEEIDHRTVRKTISPEGEEKRGRRNRTEIQYAAEVIVLDESSGERMIQFWEAKERGRGVPELSGARFIVRNEMALTDLGDEDGKKADATQRAFLLQTYLAHDRIYPRREHLMPEEPVAEGDAWSPPLEAFLSCTALNEARRIDPAKSTASARLDKIVDKDGVTSAVIVYEANLVPVLLPSGKTADEGSKAVVEGTLTIPLDGRPIPETHQVRIDTVWLHADGRGEAAELSNSHVRFKTRIPGKRKKKKGGGD